MNDDVDPFAPGGDGWKAAAPFRASLDDEARRHREEREARRRRRANPDPEPDTGDVLVLSPSAPLDSARKLISRHYTADSHRALHHQQGAFYRWSGSCYVEATQEGMRSEVYEFLDGAKVRVGNGKLATFKPNKANVGNVLDALAAVSQLPDGTRAPAWLDSQPHPPADEVLAFKNGLLHLASRTLFHHSPAFFSLNAIDYAYEADGPVPVGWLEFLQSLWSEDHPSIETLQELFGLLLTTDTSHQKAFLMIGPRRSGRGTIARVLTALLGRVNVAGPTLSSMTQNFGLAPLIGKPLAIISDARLSGRADSSVVVERMLAITGEDAITIDRKFLSAWTGRLPTRLLILTNELPRLTDASGALASRFIVLLMTRSFYGHEDTNLTEKLLHELPGILNWALVGYDRLRRRGHFVQPPSASEAVRHLEDLASPITAFIRDRCITGPHLGVEVNQLFAAWLDWCREQNREHPGTLQTFGRDLHAVLPALRVVRPRTDDGGRERYYDGVALNPNRN